MTQALDQAVEAVLRDLIFCHYKAARESRESDREHLFAFIEHFQRFYPSVYRQVFRE